jgi:nitrogen-specific signal transduction histidine kinase/CheY-like chemotaxis protein
MTEHQRAEAELRQAQKMEAVGKLTGGVAHDFNNMLAAIGGNLELIRDATARGEPIGRYVSMAERAADRGAKLVSSLLSFGRRQALKLAPMDVNVLLVDFLPLLRRAAGAIRFETRLAPALPECIADGTHFQSAILNLVLNARDATAEDGAIVLTSRPVLLTEADLLPGAAVTPGAFVAVSVTDTGSGMTLEVKEQAFDPFFTTKEVDRGSGLGLSQVYGFARQCGGHVTIDSAPGEGTAVTIFLPVATAPVAEPDAAWAKGVVPTGRRPGRSVAGTVLVVDDDVDVLAAITRILVNAGGDVIAARSGAEALPILRSDRAIGMLFTDVVMPGISGVELARQARAMRPFLPVLLTSGYADDTLREEGAMDGEFALLAKPVRPAELTACVRAALAESGG